ncbi:TM2 domain-containing protein [Actinoplanes sp. RD1]|uniref:TM2 domain-containing protein n=1 Tax=Actinoplanes sp. RD1 TaxID=3064538 RepID=UPI002740385A|nr:TM2 domain-containing protein [Actinoplanes sp. RD1]
MVSTCGHGTRRGRRRSLWWRVMTNAQYQQPVGVSDKSKLVAGILGIFLGSFGVGRFYMGDTKTGVLQLVVSLVTCGAGGLWGFIDGILILVNGGVDGQGRPLREN